MTIKQRVNLIKQPRGQAILDIKKNFDCVEYMNHGKELKSKESVSAIFMNALVANCTRFMLIENPSTIDTVFETSFNGISKYRKYWNKCIKTFSKYPDTMQYIKSAQAAVDDVGNKINNIVIPYLKKYMDIKPKDRQLTDNVIKLISYITQFDVMDSVPMEHCIKSFNKRTLSPDTIYNLKLMVERSVEFFYDNELDLESLVPRIPSAAYTETITSGHPDMLCYDALVNFTTSKTSANNKSSLEILTEYVLTQMIYPIPKSYNAIKRLVIFNPRLNIGWILNDVNEIEPETIRKVLDDVIVTQEIPEGLFTSFSE